MSAFDEFVAKNPITGTAYLKEGKVYLHIIGKAAHAQEPRNGQNAATYMATFLQQFDFGGAVPTLSSSRLITCIKIRG